VGRTARLGHSGNALLFVSPQEVAYIDILRGLPVCCAHSQLHLDSVNVSLQVEMKEVKADDVMATLAVPGHRSQEAAVEEGGMSVFCLSYGCSLPVLMC